MQSSPPEAPQKDVSPPEPTLAQLLDRPAADRIREYRYRFGQSIVFGLPVLALQFFGYSLGGADSQRWVGVFQALLTGWIIYIAAIGPLFESILRLARGQVSAELFVSFVAVAMYVCSLISVLYVPFTGHVGFRPLLFHYVVALLITWAAMNWLILSRRAQ